MKALRFLLPLLALLGVGAASAARAQAPDLPAPAPRVAPTDAASLRVSFAPVVKRAAPAVVNVFSKRTVRTQVDPFWGMFMGGGITRDLVQRSLGSGSIVRADGVILTNHHVIEGAQEIMVVTADRREWPATVLLDDPRADLAVLKIDTAGEKLPTIAIADAEDVQVGDLVLAIGDPFGVGQTVTNGIVSALARSDVGLSNYAFFIQTDAAINPGNSGGPLVDMNGDLIGVNTAILSRSGTSSGVGFAIPAAMVRQVVATALGGAREMTRPWLGARTQALTGEMAKSMGLATPQGVVVADVWPDGPAARAGIAQGDVIVSVDGQGVDDDAGLNYRIATRGIGESVAVLVRKPGRDRTVRVRLEAPPALPAKDEKVIGGHNPLNGATVINLSPAAASALGLDPFAGHGVMISAVAGGFAQNLGLRPGDFVRQVNNTKVDTTDDLASALEAGKGAWSMVFERAGQIERVQVTL
ncbi:MAG: Do family serine endopeptidase [Caulobacterales bacterium]